MPRQKSIVTIIRDLVRTEIQKALSGLFGGLGVVSRARKAGASKAGKTKPKNGRRRRRRKGTAAGGAKRGRPKGTTRRRRVGAAPQG